MRLAGALLAVIAALGGPAPAPASARERVLVFTRAEGFVHDSIPAGVAMLRGLPGVRVSVTADPRRFTAARLRRYAAVVFLSTTGDVLDRPQERALERYVRRGGGWLGIHAAADAERGWRFYQDELLAARFTSHPPVQRATIRVEDRRHPAGAGLPARWTRTDEWYSFRSSPRRRVHVVASVDERTYDPGDLRMGDHPIAWARRVGRGRAFYTALGHTAGSFSETRMRRHVAGALRWVMR
jgi:type 1 glutamine amidotransferase